MTTESSWVVLKFGGTSVSSVSNWKNVAAVVRERLAEGLHPVVVHSALSGITDRLEQLLVKALTGEWEPVMEQIERRHMDLARDLGVPNVAAELDHHFNELRRSAEGIHLIGEVSDRLRARVMANGELMATRIGAAFLAHEGIDVQWLDARTLLRADERPGATERSNYLSATCVFEPDATLQQRLATGKKVLITQGFIASDAKSDTVLLGRGGSDTSGSYFASKLAARRLEIWTDVPGMFTANPRSVPNARLLKSLDYDEAQEIASSGAKVLHPRCILPVKQYSIPLTVHATQRPELKGTVVTATGGNGGARVKAVCIKKGITLLSMETLGMWHQVGFLADAFAVFKDHGISVDLVSTSETSVTVSLDPAANTLDHRAIDALVADLAQLCRVEVIGPCAAVSLVGRNIRATLHRLGDALELFEEQKIYLVTQAANDLNITFVVDEEQGDRLVRRLHDVIVWNAPSDEVLGQTWEQIHGLAPVLPAGGPPWWQDRREELQQIAREHGAAYVYDRASIELAAQQLLALDGVDRIFYAMKANPHPEILRALAGLGLSFECVSQGECQHVLDTVRGIDPGKILFTPNFAPRSEYEWALAQGVNLTVDSLYALREWGELFRDRDVLVRLDTGFGRGHHDHVRTAGVHSKFGVPLFELDELERLVKKTGARVVGLHAHTGSGVFEVRNWQEVGNLLADLSKRFPLVRAIDLGGGLGVPEKPGQVPVDLAALQAVIGELKAKVPQLQLWIEPGRFLVAQAGVLVVGVTQLKGKGAVQYIGVATGMNSLIRPALYGAHHDIVNLSRYGEPGTEIYNVVGPICESADVLGHERLLPPTQEGDVLLVANAGAYGRAMSSSYNMREPAREVFV
ncbi:MAG TPA: bifunctional aspartate kinase/diaminopimelate decarboxylase [Steroidobacteraceae bacterium]|nr:bifunctional aspartate kinase/diaminopimelate decarboxylase [Steroidobacteraceae bacterium]